MMRRTTVGLVLASMFPLFLACNDSPTEPDGEVVFRTVLKGSLPGAAPELQGRETVRDEATWQEVWTELHSVSPPPLPAVDFRREMVIVVLGPGCNGDVTISSIVNDRGRLVVHAEGEACSNASCAIEDFSVHAVRVPRSDIPASILVKGEPKLC